MQNPALSAIELDDEGRVTIGTIFGSPRLARNGQ